MAADASAEEDAVDEEEEDEDDGVAVMFDAAPEVAPLGQTDCRGALCALGVLLTADSAPPPFSGPDRGFAFPALRFIPPAAATAPPLLAGEEWALLLGGALPSGPELDKFRHEDRLLLSPAAILDCEHSRLGWNKHTQQRITRNAGQMTAFPRET